MIKTLKPMKQLLLLLFFIFIINSLYGQENKFTLGVEYRPRSIINNGYQSPKPSNIETILSISQRSRINFGFQKDKLKTYLSVQDVRLWGDDNIYNAIATLGNTKSLGVHQAWFSLQLKPMVNLKIGRQSFNYDGGRLLSSRNWNDFQVTYDAVSLSVQKTSWKLDMALSWNAENTKNNLFPTEKIRTIDFIRYERSMKNLQLSAITIVSGNTVEENSGAIFLKGTYGVNGVYSNKTFDIKSSFYYQNNLNNKKSDISAYCFSFHTKHKFYNGKFAWGFGIDYLSGQDEKDSEYNGTIHNFDILYGVRHGAYGYIDMFSNIPQQGLNNRMIKTEYNFSEKASLQADFHWFSLNANKYDLTNPSNTLDKDLGQELDITFKLKLMKDVKLQTGASAYFANKSFKQIKNVHNIKTDFPFFGYVMITVNTNIFEN